MEIVCSLQICMQYFFTTVVGADLAQAGGEGAVHSGGILLRRRLASKEHAPEGLGHDIVVLPTRTADRDAAVAATRHRILAPSRGCGLHAKRCSQAQSQRRACCQVAWADSTAERAAAIAATCQGLLTPYLLRWLHVEGKDWSLAAARALRCMEAVPVSAP